MRLNRTLHQPRQPDMLPLRHRAPRLFAELHVPLADRLVHIHLPDPARADTLPDQVVREVAEAVQHKMHVGRAGGADGFEARELEVFSRSAGGVGAVHVAEGRREEVDGGFADVGDCVARFGEEAFHVGRGDAVLGAVDAAHLGFDGDAHAVRALS